MNKYQARILKAEYKENCFILLSCTKRNMDETFGEYRVKANVSFLYDGGNTAAEWEPEHGPIQVWHKANEGKEHYYYDFIENRPWSFCQTAVDNNQLPQAFDNGEFDYIFSVLKNWAE